MQSMDNKGLGALSAYTQELGRRHGWSALAGLQANLAVTAANQSWPLLDDEEWRRSPVKDFDLDQIPWGTAGLKSGTIKAVPSFLCRPVNEFEAEACADLEESDFASLAQVRVAMKPDHPGVWEVEAGLRVDPSLADLGLEIGWAGLQRPGAQADKAFGQLFKGIPPLADNRFQTWNIAAADAVLFVHVPKDLVLDKDIVLECALDAPDRVVNLLVLVNAEESSSVRIVERLSSQNGCLLNVGRYVRQGDNSSLAWEVFQDLDDQTVTVSHGLALLARDSRHMLREAQLGSAWIKGRHQVELLGEGSEAFLEGIYFGSREQHVDLRTVQNHVAPRAWSRAIYKGVAKDESRTIFQGLIHVNPHAPKTDAYLSNKNIILNDGARANSIPSLNIETDDVKCSHGSTTGKINEEQVFYLQNRGFSREDAKNILVNGFFDEVVNQMSPLMRTAIQDRIAKRIREA